MVNSESLENNYHGKQLYTTNELYELAYAKELAEFRAEIYLSPDGSGKLTHAKFPLGHETINSTLLENATIFSFKIDF